ncbi:hypothetical protein GCM10008922_25490 [Faecalicatena contorta]|uniref:hypothetical protein n=2 Tax=Faecalicatena contorta TaxID=39482 RepID=UPI00205D1C75|nr:hypothetical protein [Muricomes sp.]DAZ71603.1 MAG TPA: Protein of unknown function (DUF1617) [Caudoviricetes sp.]
MKIRNSQIVNFINGVMNLKEKKLPIKLGYAITRNIKIMDPVATSYEEERQKILGKYAEKDDSGKFKVEDGSYIISDISGYEREMEELLGIENEMQLHTVTIEEIEKCDMEQFDALSVQDITLLDMMME